METYLTLLYVTLEQEMALKEFFTEKGWMYCKPDLTVLTDKVGPAENPESFTTNTGKIITYSELPTSAKSSKKSATKVVKKKSRGNSCTSPDVRDVKIEVSVADEFTSEINELEKDITEEQNENDDGDNDDDFADDLEINEEANKKEGVSLTKECRNTPVRKSPRKKEVNNSDRNQVPETSSVDKEEYMPSGRKRRKVSTMTVAKIEAVMSDQQEENVSTDSLYDKQYFRTLLTEALKSSPSGKETAKTEFSVCPHCGKSIRNTNMRRHLMSHLDLPYRCTRCTLFFKSETDLETHRKEKHIGEFRCSYCGMEYRFRNSLTEHIQTRHEGTAKMYECTVCGVKMCRKSHMDDHMNVHNNVNPYSCENCSKSYKNKSAYKRHLKDCGSGNKYVCDECGQIYKSATGLQDHSRRCHDKTNSYLFYCVCGSSFKTRSSRCRHRLRCETFQSQENKSGLNERNISILRVTSTPKLEYEESEQNLVVTQAKENGNSGSQERGEVLPESLVVEQPSEDDDECNDIEDSEIAEGNLLEQQ